jgi:predicted nucleic acid-binding protein
MIFLLDISTLVALIFKNHTHHDIARKWMAGKTLAVCPLSELGFLRVAVSPAHNATIEEARTALKDFCQVEKTAFLPADISALAGKAAPSASKSTDWYLANLAEHHGMKWATLDTKANHPARSLVA